MHLPVYKMNFPRKNPMKMAAMTTRREGREAELASRPRRLVEFVVAWSERGAFLILRDSSCGRRRTDEGKGHTAAAREARGAASPLNVGFPPPACPVRPAASCTSPVLSSTPRPPARRRRRRAPGSPRGRLLRSSRLKSATPPLWWPPRRSAQQKRTKADVRPGTAPPESGPNPPGPDSPFLCLHRPR